MDQIEALRKRKSGAQWAVFILIGMMVFGGGVYVLPFIPLPLLIAFRSDQKIFDLEGIFYGKHEQKSEGTRAKNLLILEGVGVLILSTVCWGFFIRFLVE